MGGCEPSIEVKVLKFEKNVRGPAWGLVGCRVVGDRLGCGDRDRA